ncbi:MAG: DUF2971 domain-containing protein [Prevotella sp.]|nr:DUF2971 domain-containing protein [Prevotella sp.]
MKTLIESKMHASTFKELNDPMEGAFLTNVDNQTIDAIRKGKEGLRIISMIEKKEDKPCNMLMWSHYTDEHRGCCIEFHFSDEKELEKVHKVEYVKKIEISNIIFEEEVLSRKFIDWKYEQEVRHLGQEESVPIVIDKIYLGMRIDNMYNENDNTYESFYTDLIKRICPNVEVVKMQAEDFDEHHLDTLKKCNIV